jgi:hypothetical protein
MFRISCVVVALKTEQSTIVGMKCKLSFAGVVASIIIV